MFAPFLYKTAYCYYPIWGANSHTRVQNVHFHPFGFSTFKGELRNRFNLISEERVNFCEQNSENLMKIG